MLALPVELNVLSSVPLLLSRTTQKSSLVDGYVQPPANRILPSGCSAIAVARPENDLG